MKHDSGTDGGQKVTVNEDGNDQGTEKNGDEPKGSFGESDGGPYQVRGNGAANDPVDYRNDK